LGLVGPEALLQQLAPARPQALLRAQVLLRP
jgi:hypothetical protein